MKIIQPTTMVDALLVSSGVPETDYAAWNSATAYVVGNRCILTTTHKIYECLVNNTNSSPDVNLTGTLPKWLEISATNRWKAFDKKIGDQVAQAATINYVLNPGMVDSIALLNMDATSVLLVMTDATDGEVYRQTIDLTSTSNVIDGYTYCFNPIIKKTDLAIFDLPPYSTASLNITINNTGGTAKAGEIIFGAQANIGGTEYGISVSDVDYSSKTQDVFGNYTVVERAFSNRMSCNMFLDNAQADEVKRLLSLYRATPLLWVASEELSLFIIYGYRRSFNLTIPYPNNSTYSLEIEGLT